VCVAESSSYVDFILKVTLFQVVNDAVFRDLLQQDHVVNAHGLAHALADELERHDETPSQPTDTDRKRREKREKREETLRED
jgi:hypothetical protein